MCGSNMAPGTTGREDYFGVLHKCPDCGVFTYCIGLCRSCAADRKADEEYDSRKGETNDT